MAGKIKAGPIFKAGLTALLVLMAFAGVLYAQEPVKVAIMPFTMNADKDLSFLQSGIQDMLTTRLAYEGEVTVVEKKAVQEKVAALGDSVDKDKARKIGAELGADYVLFGSLTVFGASVSLDATMLDMEGQRPPVTVFEQTQGMDGLIPRVNDFAMEINDKIFGRSPAPAAQQTRPAPAVPSTHAHPDTLIPSLSDGGMVDSTGRQNAASPFVMTGTSAGKFWKSPNMKMDVQGIALGDITGDGLNETVILGPHSILVKRMEQGRFVNVAEYQGEQYQECFWLDVLDVNGNGRDEIFVSAASGHTRRAESFVLEWNGTALEMIAEKQRIYFAVLRTAGQEPALYGQRPSNMEPLLPGVYPLYWEAGEYVTGTKVNAPDYAQVFGVNFAKVGDVQAFRPIVYNNDDNLRLINAKGKVEWKGDESYGGSHKHLKLPDSQSRVYLRQRIVTADLNGDGAGEIIVNQNTGSTGKLFERYRKYTSGSFVCLGWDGLGLAPLWHTRKISGYLADFFVGDFDNDGQLELVGAVVSGNAILGGQEKSSLIAYELGILNDK
ncbi:integrin-like repeat-containing protein [Desulfatibacillum aliphaticivorans]|uniref:Integrin-like repeat-containing protein n=1 Tax=Desulfatibacillum aliphaticivorans TaxID=218208 RepID=B8FNQ3_DESAL|nr:FG-GAP-like repeat-containing protein [Desulfatibacillum aliphaticivorans]ACL06334.1 integrin-like repeat-containing protein [Desulfatibacillum aliphaticivorans]